MLSEDEFRAHVALAIRLENVSVLLGAGASKGAGGKTMSEIWEDFRTTAPASATWLHARGFVSADSLTGAATVNVEPLIDSLEIALIEWQRQSLAAACTELKLHRGQLLRAVLRAALLDGAIWARPETAADAPAFADHVRLLSRLVSNRQPGQPAPWVYTTNYDLAIEWAAEALSLNIINGFSGLHDRAFVPSNFDLGYRNVQARGEARFGTYNVYLGKVHGSLSWRLGANGSVIELPAVAQWPAVDAFLRATHGDDWPGLLIFPGSAKFVQTTGFVYGEIVRRLTEFLSRPNTCLIIGGYSFGDDHLNRVIVSALQNPTLQIVIYLPELHRIGLFDNLPIGTDPPLQPSLLLARLIRRQLPQVTICGFGSRSYFSEMTRDLPEPALLDDPAERARNLLRLMAGATAPAAAPTPRAATSPTPIPAPPSSGAPT